MPEEQPTEAQLRFMNRRVINFEGEVGTAVRCLPGGSVEVRFDGRPIGMTEACSPGELRILGDKNQPGW